MGFPSVWLGVEPVLDISTMKVTKFRRWIR